MLTTLSRCFCYHVHLTDEGTEAEVKKGDQCHEMVEKLAWAPGPNACFLALHWPEASSRVGHIWRRPQHIPLLARKR